MKIYAVIDRKSKQVVSIFHSASDEAAERSFLMLLTGPKNIFTDFPEDFDLYAVCDLQYKNGIVVSAPGVEVLNANGFNVNTFTVSDAIKLGVDYDKRHLALIHRDRYILEEIDQEEDEDVDE